MWYFAMLYTIEYSPPTSSLPIYSRQVQRSQVHPSHPTPRNPIPKVTQQTTPLQPR